jgi:parallel beta-helix repeat protein
MAPVAVAAKKPSPQPVSMCNTTITTDAILVADLACTVTNGVNIGSNDVTLDLNGHTIDGTDDSATRGNADTGGFDGITIKGPGRVQDFGIGVDLEGVSDSLLFGFATASNFYNGIVVGSNSDKNLIDKIDATDAVRVENGSDLNVLRQVTAVVSAGDGINIIGGNGNRVLDSSISGSGDAGISISGTETEVARSAVRGFNAGIYLNGATRSSVHDNTSTANIAGIRLDDGSENILTGNTTSGNSDIGIYVRGNSPLARIIGNTSVSNTHEGIIVQGGSDQAIVRGNFVAGNTVGIFVFAATGTQIENNTAQNQQTGNAIGIWVFGDNTTLNGNTVRNNASDGLQVASGTGVRIENNLATGNGDDGVDNEASGTVVKANEANANADLGIFGVPGTVDGGRNRASGNGNANQCLGVACSASSSRK